eukprot:TRINITY_DN12682_c0_g2_i4.p1 TRINITY_DN12682_c0_g2~~TRINITY_DN12682_c0_g2_i4.p1  ORF type:complete len:390 (-),score=68.98 TRINITY_DN12682_c0_g2_i4:87-1256(-)
MGSTSSLSGALSQLYILFSKFKPTNASCLPSYRDSSPAPIFTPQMFKSVHFMLRPVVVQGSPNILYAIDAHKADEQKKTILLDLGKSLETRFTTSREIFHMILKQEGKQEGKDPSNKARRTQEAFHYMLYGNILLRSQLDCQHPNLPRKVFDLKTRATNAIRLNLEEYEEHVKRGEIKNLQGFGPSFEREFFDMIRGAFLKYIFQVKIGHMDGIFVAFHNTEQIFGFEYITLEEMEACVFETPEMAEISFSASLQILNFLLERITTSKDGEAYKTSLKVSLRTVRPKNGREALAIVYVEVMDHDGGWEDRQLKMTSSSGEIRKYELKIETTLNGRMTSGPLLVSKVHNDIGIFVKLEEIMDDQDDIRFDLATLISNEVRGSMPSSISKL